MGGGDLNLKKSWHPATFRNQEKVWKEERKAAEEEKKLQQLRKELEEERQIQELQRIQEQAGGKKRSDRLDWMYQAAPTGNQKDEKALEDYLLGKRRVDDILNKRDSSASSALSRDSSSFMNQTSKANSVRDIQAKIREDPLLAIKKQEQASMELLMKNPIRMRQLKEGKENKEHKKKKSKKNKDDKAEKDERRKDKSERHNKHRSSRKHSRPSDSDDSDCDRHRHSSRKRSRHSRSPEGLGDYYINNNKNSRRQEEEAKSKAEERERRLRAMAEDASADAQARKTRLAEIAEMEAKQDAEDEARRQAAAKNGQASFLKSAQKSAYDGMSLADRVQRGRATMQNA
ncbi:RNA-splicing factor [Lobosporangium transversale]|uniref:Pre-mRNA splicing factor-domain-containing protein n=1 Tax=Lobosporangium transversale TaxID=64571 RepID=A0A1Y2GTN0_9FUNG|nr:Pre-mRNA splicing factor-domain-containing protein [Lobosporangium transversale]KAF9917463.1 RNA-splicing factor [Lobosporangium transversale]ORZ20962.1 Pre-mRNA splicing factor-domain-containing protein [Lobosporangium transversale]|eukprot:XP_021882871.1 Pre-mRNA splicing factor-domain-containing protein [Lobosporangium transversale]